MASLFTLARQIASGGSAWKYACRVVSTSNITLSGTQTIDGVALAVGDRVLVAGQTNAAQNGIYNCRATAWERSDDAKKPNDIQLGLTVRILAGTGYAGSTWAMTSPTTGTVSLGVTELVFAMADDGAQAALAERYPDRVTGAPLTDLPANPTTIIMNGQSNAAAIPPAGTLGFSAMVQYLGTDLKGWSDSTHTFVDLVDGSANMRANAGGLGTGAGPGGGQILTRVMREIADATGGTVYSISHAYSSQPIDYFRRGSATMAYYEDGTQHATKNNYTLIRDEAITSGRTVELIIFIQGESDSGVARSTYYTKLRELVEDWAEDFPSAHVLIVSCAGSSLFDGVRAAQRQVCDENPHCHYVDTTDMYGSTAFYGGNAGPHYTSFVGYEEVALRIIAKLRGLPDRPDVPVVQHADICAAWKNGYGHARTLVAGPAVSSWTDYIDGKHATEATNRPAHTVADANFAGYPSVQFTGTSSHKLTSSATDETSQDFSVFAVMKADDLSAIRYLFALEANATADRAGLMYPAFSGQAPWFETNGAGAVFTGGTAVSTSYQTIGVTYNSAATQARLYVNGVLDSTITVAATETFTTAVLRLGVAPGGAANFWTGRIAWFLLGVGIVADATAMANCHTWAQTEFKKGLAYA